jgi:hypothetical protein
MRVIVAAHIVWGASAVTKFSLDRGSAYDRPAPPAAGAPVPPARRNGTTCDLYAPGHQIHYKHQGDAVRSAALPVREAQLDGSRLLLSLEDGTELRWRHHDPERLRRILELLRGKGVVYPQFHALRVGPYWFNCAAGTDEWQECRVSAAPRSA